MRVEVIVVFATHVEDAFVNGDGRKAVSFSAAGRAFLGGAGAARDIKWPGVLFLGANNHCYALIQTKGHVTKN